MATVKSSQLYFRYPPVNPINPLPRQLHQLGTGRLSLNGNGGRANLNDLGWQIASRYRHYAYLFPNLRVRRNSQISTDRPKAFFRSSASLRHAHIEID